MYEMGKSELRAVERVLKRRRFFRYGGEETPAFEREWAKLIGVRHVTGVTSGTAALITGLQAMGIGPGDSVLVPGYTFISTALAVTAVGAIPIITEVDETLTMCPEDMAAKIKGHTACVIPVHMQGMPCNMRAIKRIAKAKGVKILEDCCQALGGSYGKKRLGSIGDAGAFSFNQYKILSCGEGGACATSNRQYGERLHMAQDGSCSVWPETGKMSSAFFCGGNFRLNDLNAAILRVQVKRLDGILGKLRRTRRMLMDGLVLPEGLRIVKTHDEAGNCGVCFLVQAESVGLAEKAEEVVRKHVGVHRPINSGRHVYSAWDVVTSRVGGHHRDWDCFKHPRNRKIKVNYRRRLKRTDDYLKRTLLCNTPYGSTAARTRTLIAKLNRALARL